VLLTVLTQTHFDGLSFWPSKLCSFFQMLLQEEAVLHYEAYSFSMACCLKKTQKKTIAQSKPIHFSMLISALN